MVVIEVPIQVLLRPESLPPAAAPAAGREGGPGGAHDAHVGFWRNPKRFNVAVTRAKALLVVVGHPVVLMEACAPSHFSPGKTLSAECAVGHPVVLVEARKPHIFPWLNPFCGMHVP